MIVSPMIVGLFKVELGGRLCYYIRSIKLVMKCMFPLETLTLWAQRHWVVSVSCYFEWFLSNWKMKKCVYIVICWI
jgi:hypothetical protein